MLNEKRFREGMETLCEIYQRKASKLLLEAYYEVLGDMSDQEFEKSIKLILQKRRYNTLPLPADILQAIPGAWDE